MFLFMFIKPVIVIVYWVAVWTLLTRYIGGFKMFKLLLGVIEHPKVFLLGLALGYLAPSDIPTVLGQLKNGVVAALTWLKGKL
jgi:hypothetical protein